MSTEEALQAVDAKERGLTTEEAEQRLERDGPNRLTARPGKPAWRRFLDQLVQPLVVILIVAAGVSVLLGDIVDALVIGGVVLVNAVIGFLQEHRAEQAIAALDALVLTEATVRRDGQKQRIPSERLVMGDIVHLASGDAVPADLRLLHVRDLQVEEAALTGESVPSSKLTGALPTETPLGDRENMAFAGTAVTYGQATGVVVATGDATQTGLIADMIAGATELATPLTRRIAALSKTLLWAILAVAGGMFAFEALRGASLEDTFSAAVALAVGAIPEGLPAAVTVLLAVGVSTMARRRALVRRLPAVETLGSTTVICSDKTGTLTENQMTVTRLLVGGAELAVTGAGYQPDGAFLKDGAEVDPAHAPGLAEALRIGALCNDSRIVRGGTDTKVEGDPTEAALLVAAEKAGAALDLDVWQRIAEIPFESQHMYMATLHEAGGERVLRVKGSSDALLGRCTGALSAAGEPAALDVDAVQRDVEHLAREGLRVLCLARRVVEEPVAELGHGDVRDLTLVGLVGMMDPPREAAVRAVAVCQRAGIQVKMITGDHAATASAIAAKLGLEGARDSEGRLRAVTGRELEGIDRGELGALAEQTSVFARVAPEQKLLLVEALQGRGHVVAMTGDGVNDAPALKQADIGIAMGKGGTDVARGASAMILTDDNFATIEAAIEEGRGVFDNLVKFIAWTLPTNGGEALVLLAAVVTGAALPILPVQILWVNMATAVLLGIALVFEPKEPGLMDRPPRRPDAPILTLGLGVRTILVSVVVAAATFGLFRVSLERQGVSIAEARTIAVNAIVVLEAAYLFACRSLRYPIWRIGVLTNPWVWAGAIVMMLVQLLFTYLPLMNRLFHSAPIDAVWWGYLAIAGVALYVLVEGTKVVRVRRLEG
jgi:cation-transporting P-type ATPase F